jgi:phage-related protein
MEPVFIGCKNTRSVYYIHFFQEKSPKNKTSPASDLHIICLYKNLVGVKMASRVGGIML